MVKVQADTIVARATSPGQSALAIIRMSGAKAITLAADRFSNPALLKNGDRKIHYGKWYSIDGSVVDDLILALFLGPRSFTGEDTVEIFCHGSEYIVRRIIDDLLNTGARLAEPGEFSMRAYLNGKMDLTQAEAVMELIQADSHASHTLAMQQLRGGLSEYIVDLRDQLLHVASLIELELDFAEEDVEFADRSELKSLLDKIIGVSTEMQETFRDGNAFKSGFRTVIAGKPNAGKSTLLNALLLEDRAIVSSIPGTTRDTVEEKIIIGGVAFRLIDTAGLRNASDQVEEMGIQRSFSAMREADIVLYMIDPNDPDIAELLKWMNENPEKRDNLIVLLNKSDLNMKMPVEQLNALQLPADRIVRLSAKNKIGIAGIKQKMLELATRNKKLPADLLTANRRHLHAFTQASQYLHAVRAALEKNTHLDMISADLRHAIGELNTILGESIDAESILSEIFSSFCIGK